VAYKPEIFTAGGITLTTTTTVELGDTNIETVSRWLVTVHDESSMNVSILPKGVARNSGKTKYALGYANTNAPDTNINSGSTAITAAGNYLIEASGMDVDLVVTVSGGTVRLMARPVKG
jgi:hypothetical protein